MQDTLIGIINHFKKFTEKQKWQMQDFHAQTSSWGESTTLSITMYSKERLENGNGAAFSISANMDADNYNLEVMELQLKAEYALEMHKLGRKNLVVS